MRLPDDDELYEVDQSYLGPPGRYIAVMRHKTIFASLIVTPVAFVAARRLGMPMTLMSIGLLLLACIGLAMTIADKTSHERGIGALLTALWHDLTARRSPTSRPQAARGDAFRRITDPAGLPARVARRTERADAPEHS